MRRLRETVAAKNVYAWAGHFLQEIHRIATRLEPLREVS
jgi:hypothetical protein